MNQNGGDGEEKMQACVHGAILVRIVLTMHVPKLSVPYAISAKLFEMQGLPALQSNKVLGP